MVGESNQNVFLIQIDASNFAEFEYPSSRYRELTVFVFQESRMIMAGMRIVPRGLRTEHGMTSTAIGRAGNAP